MKKPYQDQWRKGRLVKAGRRECARRYDAVREAVGSYCGRGCTVADVGGWDGYFPTRLREDRNLRAEAVNIDSRAVKLPYHRQMKVTADNVHEIGQYDAILCLSVLHHMEDWREVYEGLKKLCRVLIVEVCHPDETQSTSPVIQETGHRIEAIYEAVMADATEVICETPCLDDPQVKRPTVLILPQAAEADDTEARVVRGTVEPGSGQAAGLMEELDPAEWDELGYVPWPGTLNLCVSEDDHAWLKTLPAVEGPGLRRSPRYVPVWVTNEYGGHRGHIHFARSPKGRKVIELVAQANLRAALYLDDGDTVQVEPE